MEGLVSYSDALDRMGERVSKMFDVGLTGTEHPAEGIAKAASALLDAHRAVEEIEAFSVFAGAVFLVDEAKAAADLMCRVTPAIRAANEKMAAVNAKLDEIVAGAES